MFKPTPVKLALVLALLGHAGVFFSFPTARGPDWTLYLGSALELFRPLIRNPYILMDRNGFYPWLGWLFLHLPGQITSLVVFQHLLAVALTAWSVRLMQGWFDRLAGYLTALVLGLSAPLLFIPQVTNSEAACLISFWPLACSGLALALDHQRGRSSPAWLWGLFGLCAGLAFLARLSGLVLALGLMAALWAWGLPRRSVLVSLLVLVVMALGLMSFNYLRLGYFGTEYKAGRTLFAILWQEDKNILTSNGPHTSRLVYLLRRLWDREAARNPVIQRNGRHINQILDNPRELPYHLYYLIVNLTRRELPYQEADRLLRQVALEAFWVDPVAYLERRWHKFLAAFAGRPFAEVSFVPPRQAQKAEDRFYASERRYSYRGVSELYHMRGRSQSQQDVRDFLRDYNGLSWRVWQYPGWPAGQAFFQAWYRLLTPKYRYLYALALVFLAGLALAPRRLESRLPPRPAVLVFGALLLGCLGNWGFVYLISAGRVLHMLACLPLELILVAGGLWTLARLALPAPGTRERV